MSIYISDRFVLGNIDVTLSFLFILLLWKVSRKSFEAKKFIVGMIGR